MANIYAEYPYLDGGAAAICIAVKCGSSELVHADVTDYLGLLVWIILVGPYTGANLKIAQLGQVIGLRHGDAIGVAACLLAHGSTPV